MLRKLAIAAATAMVLLAPAVPGMASASSHAPLVFSNVGIFNNINPGAVEFNGLGNLITAGASPSTMSQNDCQSVNWLHQFDVNVCQWHNASGLCMGASNSDELIRAEVCTGSTTQLWWTARVPNAPVNNFYILNQHWSGVCGCNQYLVPLSSSLNSDISAGFSLSQSAIWLIGAF